MPPKAAAPISEDIGPHAQAIGYATHQLDNQTSAEVHYKRKARVGWTKSNSERPGFQKYCELPNPSQDGRGVWTGARRAPYPVIHRPYTSNTRRHIVGHRKFTHMNHYGFDADVVESKPVPPLIPEGSRLAQEGCPEICRQVPGFRPGKNHYLFETSRG